MKMRVVGKSIEFSKKLLFKKRVHDNSVPCKCGSGDYCHRHRAYGLEARGVLFEPPTFRLLGASSMQSGRRRIEREPDE